MEKKEEARAFIELTSYRETSVEDWTFCFKFLELQRMYEERLAALGIEEEVNKVWFKEQILHFFPKAQEQNDRKKVVIIFDQGMRQMLKQAFTDYEGDASILATTAKIIREHIFKFEGFHFDATFKQNCQEDSIPTTLKMLVSMMLKGPTLKNQETQNHGLHLQYVRQYSSTAQKWLWVRQNNNIVLWAPIAIVHKLNEHTLARFKKGSIFARLGPQCQLFPNSSAWESTSFCSLPESAKKDLPDTFDVKVLDGAAVVNLLPVSGRETFDHYAADVLLPHVQHQLQTADRDDIVLGQVSQKQHQRFCQRKERKGHEKKGVWQEQNPRKVARPPVLCRKQGGIL